MQYNKYQNKKKPGRIFVSFALFIVPMLFLMVGGILEDKIKGFIGKSGWDIYMVVSFSLLMISVLLPVVMVLKNMFSGEFTLFLSSGKKAERIRNTGIPATATVIYIGENSRGGVMTINDQPVLNLQLEVKIGNSAPYRVSFDSIIPRADVAKFQPGVSFPVRVDPKDKTKVVFDYNAKIDESMPTFGNKWSEDDNISTKLYGRNGKAKVKEIVPTGKSAGFNIVVKITYEVFPEEGEPYVFSKEVSLPTEVVKKIEGYIGKTVKCRIHPSDKTKIKLTFY